MKSEGQLKALADFFLDSAKIIFGSAVVSTLLPGITGEIPWLTITFGIIATATFLILAMKIIKIAEEIRV